ncbi:Pycsar system effector family protein [Polaribacter gochangensis]|uniref:Pycsar system effector family protein n=1 Tax=Polaribacter gochangensis TaxID=3252903 RepID=UPI0039049A22
METLLLNAEKYVFSLLTKELSGDYFYHNLNHTQRVVNATKELLVGEHISEVDANLLLLAAWFHDVGYIKGTENHEESSVRIATNFLEEYNIDESIINTVNRLIRATKMDVEADDILEKIIKDADCVHLSKKSFSDISDLLKEELNKVCDKNFTDSEWIQENINFLTSKHYYYTNYAQQNWQEGKDKNLAQLFKNQKKIAQVDQKNSIKKEELKIKKQKAKTPERGIETMFRVTLRNHITLSDIADTKANILLSVNAIIISLALSSLLPKLDNPSNQYLIAPTIVFVIFTITSIILSVLATRPNVTEGKFSKKDVEDKKVNLLFFGNFHKMSLKDFEWAMGELMKDKDYLYNSMTKDLYFLGKVLDRKYKLLRITYMVFMIGIIVSVLSFGIAFKIKETGVLF